MSVHTDKPKRESRLIIKICGIRDSDNLQHAIQAGANAIGFMQVPTSPRYITAEEAGALRKEITAHNNDFNSKVLAVAVVANQDQAEVKNILELVQPDLVQFHGDESEDFCQSFSIPYIKAIQATSAEDISVAAAKYPSANYLLLDSPTTLLGGSGQVFDWNRIPQAGASKDSPLVDKLIIAGGLNARNVTELLQMVKPAGVDVSSGVEEVRGIKNPRMMKEFVAAAQTLS